MDMLAKAASLGCCRLMDAQPGKQRVLHRSLSVSASLAGCQLPFLPLPGNFAFSGQLSDHV
jgi:hypothetical protein